MESICTKLQGGTWLDVLEKHLSWPEVMALKSIPQSTLLNAAQLKVALGKDRATQLLKLALPILPEISIEGKRRCVYVDAFGVRCRNYSEGGCCMSHAVKVTSMSSHFKSKDIRDAYDKFKKDPRRLSLDGELAILRLLMTQVINLCTNSANGQMGMQGIQAATVLADKIRSMIETISSISKLTPEYVDNLLNKVIEASTDYIEPHKLNEFAKRVQALMLLEPEPDQPIEVGTVMEVNGEEKVVEVEEPQRENIQIRALLRFAHANGTLPPEEIEALKKQHGITDLNC
jgi:hypothetical protein